MIPYGRQDITQADIDAVVDVLKSDFLTQGPMVPRFEALVSGCCGAQHAVAVNSATSALHIACLTLGLGQGDIVWTTPNTFVASANCARYCGADVDFVDIDPDTWNISTAELRKKLEIAARNKRLPKIVIPVHFAGQPTDQEEIWELAQEFGFKVIEDASHAIGASRNGEKVGSCRWSDITVFSFHPVKIITTGEGGIALTNDGDLFQKMSLLRSHGITRDPSLMVQPVPGSWYYEQLTLGFNYRMTDIQAALGCSQITRLDTYIEQRNRLATEYFSALSDLPFQLPTVKKENRSAFHLFVIRLTTPDHRRQHAAIFEELRAQGIGVNLHYMPVHLQPYYRELGFSAGLCPEAEAYSQEAISLPLYAQLTDNDQRQVIDALRRVANV